MTNLMLNLVILRVLTNTADMDVCYDGVIDTIIDTGATISFISRDLVPLLRRKHGVKASELSVMLGNGETQDTDHYVEVDLMLKHEPFRAELHLLDLPVTFDVIVGLDWLDRHDGHAHARARTLDPNMDLPLRSQHYW